jgi:hypothetical protein
LDHKTKNLLFLFGAAPMGMAGCLGSGEGSDTYLTLTTATTFNNDEETSNDSGDGDGDGGTTAGDGDGDPTAGDGDGDGDPTTGDGDGDSGDGDGDSGDGDGDSGDGDGDTGDPEDCSTNPIPWCTADTYPTPNDVPDEPPGLGGCPPGMGPVDTFCVDRWEAALVEILPNDALGPWSPFRNPSGVTVRAVSAPGLVPQGYISQEQAAAACSFSGKRLCSNTEWLRACQGAQGNIYPFGNRPAPGTCNDARTCHPAIQYFESAADWIWSELDHPCLNQLPAGLAATDEHPGCVSADGMLDMMGNLHEWTADPEGTFRGGFYVDTMLNGPGCLYATTAHTVTYWDYSTGFRCCAD